jgi:hypothetical protein
MPNANSEHLVEASSSSSTFDLTFLLAWLFTYACLIAWRYRKKKTLSLPHLLLNAVWATLLSPIVYGLLFFLGFFLLIPLMLLGATVAALLLFGGPFALQYKLRRKATLSIHPSGPLSAGSAVDVSIQFERQDLVGRMVRFTLAENENTTENPSKFRKYEKSESINALGQASCSFVLPSDAGEFERRIWRLFVVVKGFPLAPETLDLPVADRAGHIETAWDAPNKLIH